MKLSTVRLSDGSSFEVRDDADEIRNKLYSNSDFIELRGWSMMDGEVAIFINKKFILRISARETT